LRLRKNNGDLFVIKYLKACQLAVQKKIAGQPFVSLRDIEPDWNLPRLATSGLPAIIGTRDRKALVQFSYKTIRLYLSIFSLYRVLSGPVKPKIGTITDPYSGTESGLAKLDQ